MRFKFLPYFLAAFLHFCPIHVRNTARMQKQGVFPKLRELKKIGMRVEFPLESTRITNSLSCISSRLGLCTARELVKFLTIGFISDFLNRLRLRSIFNVRWNVHQSRFTSPNRRALFDSRHYQTLPVIGENV